MENLEKKSLTQKLKQNSKNILYSLTLLIVSGIIIAYAGKKITSIDTSIKATTGDELTSDWVNAVNTELKYLRDKVDGGSSGGRISVNFPAVALCTYVEGNLYDYRLLAEELVDYKAQGYTCTNALFGTSFSGRAEIVSLSCHGGSVNEPYQRTIVTCIK